MDEERVIEPEDLPEGAKFNGYREYDVQDLILKRHNIRFLLGEYITREGRTIVGQLPTEYQSHYGVTLISFVLYQHAPLPSAPTADSGATEETGHRYFCRTCEPAADGE